MRVTVRVVKADRRRDIGFGPFFRPPTADDLRPALGFDVPNSWGDMLTLERTFEALNSPEPAPVGTLTLNAIARYHKAFPSLSVGDVVTLDDRGYVCASVGWEQWPAPGGYEPTDDDPDGGIEEAIEKANDYAAWRAEQREGNRSW